MLVRLRCKLFGHNALLGHVQMDGKTWMWCKRENKWVLVFPGWDVIHEQMDV